MQWVSGNEFTWDASGLDEELYFWGDKSYRAAEKRISKQTSRLADGDEFLTRTENLARVKGDFSAEPALLRRTRFTLPINGEDLARYVTETNDVDYLFDEDDATESVPAESPSTPLMDEDEFWGHIDVLGGEVSDVALARLENHLRQLPTESIRQFAERFAERLFQLDQHIIYKGYKMGGWLTLGEDGFLYYRATALAAGRESFDRYLARTDKLKGQVDALMEGEMLLSVSDDALRYHDKFHEHHETAFSFETGSNEAHWPAPRWPGSVEPNRFFVRIAAIGTDGAETFVYGWSGERGDAIEVARSVDSRFEREFANHTVHARQLFLGQNEGKFAVRAFSIRYLEKPPLGVLPVSRLEETVIAG